MKKIVIFGANSRTGVEISSVAQEDGFKIQEFNKKNPSIKELCEVLRGTGGAIIVFGPRPPYTDIFCADTTNNIITAMKIEKVKRLVCQTGAMIGNYPQNRSMFFEMFSRTYRNNNPHGYEDRTRQEDVVMNSSLEWTIVKPPRLTHSTRSETLQVGEKIKVGLLSSVSRKSLARFILGEILTPRFIQKVIFVKN